MLVNRGFPIFLVVLSWISDGFAAGFQIGQQSVTSMSRSLGGAGVAGDDLGDIFFNAAGVTQYDKTQFQLGGVALFTDNNFDNKGSFQMLGGATVPSRGPDDSIDETGFSGNMYMVHPYSEQLYFGLAVAPTFGQSTKYDRNWVGRYHAVESDLRVIDFNPLVGYRFGNGLSLGAGAIYQTIDATLSQAVFTGPFTADGFAEVKGDDGSWGFNVGIMYEFQQKGTRLDGTRLGLSFRSGVEHTLSGKRKVSGTGIADGKVGAKADLQLPETVYLSLWHPLTEDLNLALTARWTNWSRNDEIRIEFDDGSPDDVTPQDWNDSWMVGVAADYRLNDRWHIRGGLGYDETPIPDSSLRTPRNPDADTLWFSLGASYRLGEGEKQFIDVAYVGWRMGSASIATTVDLNPLAPGTVTDTLVGEYDSNVIHAVGLQYRYVFE